MTEAFVRNARVVEVERQSASNLPPAQFMQDYVGANRPVVIENAVPDWPALHKWSPDYFRAQWGDTEVDVSYRVKMKMGEFVDAMLASSAENPGPYLYRLFICPHMPQLLPDVQPQNLYCFPYRYASPLMPTTWRRPDGYIKLLMGGAGSRFPIVHFDGENAHASVTQVYGEKQFVLFPPSDSPSLYPKDHIPNHSWIQDIEHAEAERFPLFARATRYQTTLRPGEMIFIPCGWWHAARVSGPSISIGQNLLDHSNWSRFVSLVCAPGTGSLPRRLPRRLWLNAAGVFFNLRERLLPPRAAHPRSRIARLDPMFREEMRAPATWPMATWTQS